MKHTYKKVVSVVFLIFAFACYAFPEDTAQAQTSTGFRVTQKVRNLTKQNLAWVDSAQADPQERIEFQITVVWQGSQSTQNVLAREVLAEKLAYAGNLKLDGISAGGDISKENISVGLFASGQSKVISFEAQVVAAELLSVGTTNLMSTITVFNSEGGATTATTVQVTKAGSPTDVSTGALSIQMLGAVLFFALVVCAGSFWMLYLYIKRQVFESPYATRTDRKLAAMISRLKGN